MKNLIKELKKEIDIPMGYLSHESHLNEFGVETNEEIIEAVIHGANSAEYEVGYIKGLEQAIRIIRAQVKELPKITIPMSEEDCNEILRGNTHDWKFSGVEVHIELEDNIEA